MTQTKTSVTYKKDSDGHYICDKCDYRTPSTHMSTMFYHMKTHTNDFPYECTVCNSGFAQKQTLFNHMKARHPEHLKEKVKNFKCPIDGCQYESITKGNCQTHCARRHFSEIVDVHHTIRTVEMKKIYHCECCTKDFKSAPAFYNHILKCLYAFQLIGSEKISTLL